MVAWLKSPRGSTATATAVAAILALFWLAPWTRPLPRVAGLPLAGDTGGTASVGAADPSSGTAPSLASATSPQSSTSPQSATSAQSATSSHAATSSHPEATTASGSTVTAATGSGSQDAAAGANAPPAIIASAEPTSPAASASSAAAEQAALSAAAPARSSAPGSAPSATPVSQALPSFDVVRVEPTGAAIVAGRGEPGSTVTLLDGGRVVAKATVDAAGQFAMLPPDLGEGNHYLTLQAGSEPQGSVSKQGVVIAVPKSGGGSRPMVAMLSPDQPVRVLSDGSSSLTPTASAAASTAGPVAIQAVEASSGGKFTASGVAKAGSQSRLYLNGAFLADVTAGKDGRWAVRVEKGMRPGQYVVRADELENASGKVVHRAEVPFTYPVTLGKGAGKQLLMGRALPPVSVLASSVPAPVRIASTGGPSAVAAAGVTSPGAAVPTSPGAAVPTSSGSATAMTAAKPGKMMLGLVSPTPGTPASVPLGPVNAAVVPDLKLTTVTRGDSLWRISRKLLGHGIDYTEIYASNTTQIRDPALIYPGQIFVLPQRPTK